MSNSHEARAIWHPQTRQDRDAVLSELQEILASPHFCNSKRYPGLLKYIVENTLAGKAELLKERTLGVEVFGRPPTYDTNADTVVRYTAGEVRKRLLLYYSEHGRPATIQISLPSGSYVPEFVDRREEATEKSSAVHNQETTETNSTAPEAGFQPQAAQPTTEPTRALRAGLTHTAKRLLWLGLVVVIVLGASVGIWWRHRTVQPQAALDEFWAPVLRDQATVLICTGSSVFTQNSYNGNVVTADKGTDYSFVSIQIASSIAEISGLLEHAGATPKLESAATTPLTELREHAVIQIGGYNNQWTVRLLQPLRFHFEPEPDAAIVDQLPSQEQPQRRWARDHSQAYSSADDYALVARYRDTTTGSWVVALAGLGRNGTEAAAQFAVSPHYMQLLRDQLGRDFANHNLEAVLKVSVIDGKTGAPSILAVHSW
jgi:hypothetical protein